MDKNIQIFASFLLLILVSNSLGAMQPGLGKPSPTHFTIFKKNPSTSSLPQTTTSTSLASAGYEKIIEVLPSISAKPKEAQDTELEGELLPNASDLIVEVELEPNDPIALMKKKAENFIKGTHTTLLATLDTLKPNEVASNSLANQAVILSAITNLVNYCDNPSLLKKADLDEVQKLLNYVESKKGNKPVITIDNSPLDALKSFLEDFQSKLFAKFQADYLEQMKPIRKIAQLTATINRVRGNKTETGVTMNSLTQANIEALDQIMQAMKGLKIVPQDQKQNVQ